MSLQKTQQYLEEKEFDVVIYEDHPNKLLLEANKQDVKLLVESMSDCIAIQCVEKPLDIHWEIKIDSIETVKDEISNKLE